jgi:O-antigen chain-terminating methyltransferase
MSSSQSDSDHVRKEIEQETKDPVELRRTETVLTNEKDRVHPSDNAFPSLDLSALRRELASAQGLWNLVGQVNPRPPGLVNDGIQLVKRTIRRLLLWYTRPIVAFQGNITRILNQTADLFDQASLQIANQQATMDTLGKHLGQVEETTAARLESLHNQMGDQLAQIVQLRGAIEGVARLTERNSRRVAHLLEEKAQSLPLYPPGKIPAVPSPDTKIHLNFDYFAFEERFRGSEAEIKERQRIYVPYFQGRENVLDLGCGRGEFLELMREHEISARGVDVNADMVYLCQQKELGVAQDDLLTYLQSLPNDSLGGVFAAQVIEHLSMEQLIRLVQLARQKLARSAPLVLETVNPECLLVFARAMYLDPSHVRPVHPKAVLFILESNGYNNVELKCTSPVEEEQRIPLLPPELVVNEQVRGFNHAIEKLNELLYGYQDYAVIGYR